MQMKAEAGVRVAATLPSQKVSATPRRQFQQASQPARAIFARRGVAATRGGNCIALFDPRLFPSITRHLMKLPEVKQCGLYL